MLVGLPDQGHGGHTFPVSPAQRFVVSWKAWEGVASLGLGKICTELTLENGSWSVAMGIGLSMIEVGNVLKIPRQTMERYFKHFLELIPEVLADYIAFPDDAEAKRIVKLHKKAT